MGKILLLSALFILNMAYAKDSSHSITGFSILKESQAKRTEDKKDITGVSFPEKQGLRDWSVQLDVSKTFKQKDGTEKKWIDKIQIHFTNKEMAKSFFEIMNSKRSIQLSFDIYQNSYNSDGPHDGCAFLDLFCHSLPSKIISLHDIEGNKLLVRDSSIVDDIPLEEYLQHNNECL